MSLAKYCTPSTVALALASCQATPPPAAPCPPATTESAESAGAPAEAAAPRRLVIQNSELIDLHSEQTGRDYELIVGVPDSYAKEPERRYPVLYLLDGQWDLRCSKNRTCFNPTWR
jgi:hypothetical protein